MKGNLFRIVDPSENLSEFFRIVLADPEQFREQIGFMRPLTVTRIQTVLVQLIVTNNRTISVR